MVVVLILLLLSVYSYAIYPLVLITMDSLRSPEPKDDSELSDLSLTLIVAVHNEEKRVRRKIEGSLELRKVVPDLEILFASDCSTDNTDRIIGEYAEDGVKLIKTAERLGKENAQRDGISVASGSVLVFSDVATTISPESIANLRDYFGSSRVGAVSSVDRVVSPDGTLQGEGLYVRYEMFLRAMESRAGGLVGLSGSFFAARRSICDHWDLETPSDFNTALRCAEAGILAISAKDVIGEYKDIKSRAGEYQRKRRTVVRGMNALFRNRRFLNPRKYGVFAWQLFSHKLMRWLAPVFLIAAIVATLVTRQAMQLSIVLAVVFGLCVGVFLFAAASAKFRSYRLIGFYYYFVLVNLAILDAWWLFVRGRNIQYWSPSQR